MKEHMSHVCPTRAAKALYQSRESCNCIAVSASLSERWSVEHTVAEDKDARTALLGCGLIKSKQPS